MFDVIIVGAGPAGLSAALILGRSLRTVLVCDTGHPRNAASRAMHGYLTRDGMPPSEFLQIGREQMRQYETVEFEFEPLPPPPLQTQNQRTRPHFKGEHENRCGGPR